MTRWFYNANVLCDDTTGALRACMNFSPSIERQKEEEFCELLMKAARIVSGMKTPDSRTTALLRRLRRNLSFLEKDEVREGLKREISTALEAGGIRVGMIQSITMVFVNMLMEGIELVYAEPGESIVLYLRCLSLEMLLRVRDVILSGLLLRVLSDAIKRFVETQPRVQLVVQEEDMNLSLLCLHIAAGLYISLLFDTNC